MFKPKMILFDYGETLIHEMYFDPVKGTEAVLKYSSNHLIDAHEIQKLALRLSNEQRSYRRIDEDNNYIELPNWMFQKYLYDYYQIKINLNNKEMEKVFWDAAAPYEGIAGCYEFLKFLQNKKIRIGVISNISFSNQVLRDRLHKVFPRINFEIIISSADYGIRKPNRLIFEVALRRAGLKSNDVVYCGDNYASDIMGALNANILPIWFNGKVGKDYISIKTWKEMEKMIEDAI